jgi:hypothetical protein
MAKKQTITTTKTTTLGSQSSMLLRSSNTLLSAQTTPTMAQHSRNSLGSIHSSPQAQRAPTQQLFSDMETDESPPAWAAQILSQLSRIANQGEQNSAKLEKVQSEVTRMSKHMEDIVVRQATADSSIQKHTEDIVRVSELIQTMAESHDTMQGQINALALEVTQIKEAQESAQPGQARPLSPQQEQDVPSWTSLGLRFYSVAPIETEEERLKFIRAAARESFVPESEVVGVEIMGPPKLNSLRKEVQQLRVTFRSSAAAYKVYRNRKKLEHHIAEDLTETQHALKVRRMPTYERLRREPGTWVMWRGATLWVNSNYKECPTTKEVTNWGWWDRVTVFDAKAPHPATNPPPLPNPAPSGGVISESEPA